MCAVLSATPNWFDLHQYLALWLEGIALLAIFIWDRMRNSVVISVATPISTCSPVFGQTKMRRSIRASPFATN